MFDPSDIPRVIGVPPGADFPKVLAENVLAAHVDRPPEDLARVLILVNTRRMARRLTRLFSDGPARLLPRIGLITDVDALLPDIGLPPRVSRLRRKLELTQLTTRLIEAQPDLAARASAVDLADSLAAILDELQGEGVKAQAFRELTIDVGSYHWERSLKFLDIAAQYIEAMSEDGMDDEARRRAGVSALIERWEAAPPKTPVIVAGSTGSRSTTRMLMCAAARLPQGAICLPGFDFDLPATLWERLSINRETEDHPQYRFARILADLGLSFDAVKSWGKAPDADRNRLVSLSLRPAQVTDQWLNEGPRLGRLTDCTSRMSLIEAAQPKEEALAIATALRKSVEERQSVALITPDRTLARRVTATLSRWNIYPDDSAGMPLSLTPPGRFLRQVGRMIGAEVAPDQLVALLKHPLCRTGQDDRGPHLLNTRRLELYLRKHGVVDLSENVLTRFAMDEFKGANPWTEWLGRVLAALKTVPAPHFGRALSHHVELAEMIASGGSARAGKLWETSSGRACLASVRDVSWGKRLLRHSSICRLSSTGRSRIGSRE